VTAPESVVRWVPTYVRPDGRRTLLLPMQGRYTYETETEARRWLDGIVAANSLERRLETWGPDPRFEVREVECYPVHFDPKTRWFDL